MNSCAIDRALEGNIDTRLRDGAAFLGTGRTDNQERICRLASNIAFREIVRP